MEKSAQSSSEPEVSLVLMALGVLAAFLIGRQARQFHVRVAWAAGAGASFGLFIYKHTPSLGMTFLLGAFVFLLVFAAIIGTRHDAEPGKNIFSDD